MSIGAKVLITGISNSGKTTLLNTLENAFVISRDGKPFPLAIPHTNIPEYEKIDDLLDIIQEKLDLYREKFNQYPETIAFDSVSRIFTDIETNANKKFKGFEVWSQINKEINTFVEAINTLQNEGFNIVLIAHAVWDESAKRYIETCKGSFSKIGGFTSVVDYALNIDMVGNKRIITTRGNNLSRTLLEGVPDKIEANDFNLQQYLNAIKAKSTEVQTKWSI